MKKNRKDRCYLCGHRCPQKAFEKLGWDILHCNKCGLYSLDFSGSYQKFIREYYNKGFFTGGQDRAGYLNYEGDRKAEEKNMQTFLWGIQKFKKSGKLLDIGCATGLFMLKAKEEGFDVFGVDVSDYAVGIAKKRFVGRVKKSSIEKAVYKEKSFDIITMFDVVEHVQDPKKVLQKLRGFLKDDGLLVLNTGDADSFLARLQGKDWHFFIPPQHFFYFSKATLSKILAESGFNLKKVDRKGKWLTLRYLFHLARQIQKDAFGRLGFALVGKIAPGRIPIYINLFDNITVYAVKKKTKKKTT